MPVILGIVLITAISTFWGGFVAATLWGWFVVPLGVPAINYWHAAGLCTTLGVFMGSRGISGTENETVGDILARGFIFSAGLPLLSLIFGWLVHGQI